MFSIRILLLLIPLLIICLLLLVFCVGFPLLVRLYPRSEDLQFFFVYVFLVERLGYASIHTYWSQLNLSTIKRLNIREIIITKSIRLVVRNLQQKNTLLDHILTYQLVRRPKV